MKSMTGENYFKSAYSYLYIRDFARAEDAFRRAIESNPNNPEYYFHASVTALRNDRLDLASEWVAAATRLDPENPLYREHQAVVRSCVLTRKGHEALLEGSMDEALQAFEEALTQDPMNEDAIRSLEKLRLEIKEGHL